ncbi:MAG: purine-binding chemotaxis protein CheW [Chloroflexi bacterium]|nr:purine-binding chemotaxis protein CheW [Chloroflexota bacterium]
MATVESLHPPRQLVVFRVGTTRYGIDIELVNEILSPLPVTLLPGVTRHVAGVVEVRDRVMPVFDLRSRFKSTEPTDDHDSRMVLVEVNDGPVAMTVDGVEEVVTVPREAYQSIAAPGDRSGLGYLKGVVRRDGHLVLWIDPRALIPSGTLELAAA